ncbi:MAG: GWxTD domain-containing protein [Candidatus Kapabacteria bacterium]|nr:GWxTD domain-containing protein [Ignavibacteriota bacterium]MCW5884200.1 GWxTD domain-containing protein [Candidatus Kapabacteria bacterium]
MNFQKKLFLIIFIANFFYLGSDALGQKQQFDRASFYSFGIRLFSEAHTLPDISNDSVNVLIFYKIAYEALAFIQVNPLENPGQFQAVASVEVFFRDNSGIIRNRSLLSDSLWVSSYEETQSKDLYKSGYHITKLATSEYTCTVQLLDRYKKPADKNELKISANQRFLSQKVISDPIFAFSSDKLPAYRAVPFILGNKINFTSSDARILIPVSYKPNFNVFNYNIEKKILESDKFWNEPINVSGRAIPSENSYLDVQSDDNFPFVLSLKTGFKYDENFGKDLLVGVLNIELPSAQLSPGTYTLKINNDTENDSAQFDFDVIWVDMPLALRNPKYAIETMYYILDDAEYKEMNSGSDADKSRKIMDYWKSKDPTKSTPYNEAMTEYFRRVDYAFFNFQTLREKDGAKSERGKIYILHGKADNIEKKLVDGKQFEIWNYNMLGKSFHFELVTNGLYILREITNIVRN